jgi:hypothetical protein
MHYKHRRSPHEKSASSLGFIKKFHQCLGKEPTLPTASSIRAEDMETDAEGFIVKMPPIPEEEFCVYGTVLQPPRLLCAYERIPANAS